MYHDHNVSAFRQCFRIAGLLVAPITVIAIVHKVHQAQFTGNFHSTISARVVNEDADVNDLRQLVHGLLQRFFGVIGRHDNGDAFSVKHEGSF